MKEVLYVSAGESVDREAVELIAPRVARSLGCGVEYSGGDGPGPRLQLEITGAIDDTAWYRITGIPGGVHISAPSRAGLFAGAGEVARGCLRTGALTAPEGTRVVEPAIPSRLIYSPGHFRNSYEEASPEEMRDLLHEMAFWGADAWGDWFDPNDMTNPYGSDLVDSKVPYQYWQNKKDLLRQVAEVGLRVHIALSPNHVFVDQVRPDILATKTAPEGTQRLGRRMVHGNLVCPAQPAAHAIILENHEKLLADLAESGIPVDIVSFFLYDNGGCLCEKCDPWLETVIALDAEVAEIVRRHNPSCQFDLCGWYLSDEEIDRVQDLHEAGRLEWVDGLEIALSGGSRDVGPMAALRTMGRQLFVNLGYSGDNVDDVYGLCGGVMAPARMGQIVRDAAGSGCRRLVGYGEGTHDDINKVLMCRLSVEPGVPAETVLQEYAQWYFSASPEQAAEIAELLAAMERGAYTSQPEVASRLHAVAATLDEAARGTWRFKQLEYRMVLCDLDSRIGKPGEWNDVLARRIRGAASDGGADVLATLRAELDGLRDLVRERYRVYRRMNREVYNLGFFGLFEWRKRESFHEWWGREAAALETLPAGSSLEEALAHLVAGATEVKSLD